MQPRLLQPLQGQPVGDGEAEDVFGPDRRVDDFVADQPFQLGQLADLERQLLFEILLQAGQTEGVAQADQLIDLGVAVRVGEVAERPLHLADEIVEDRLERRRGSSSGRATWWRCA